MTPFDSWLSLLSLAQTRDPLLAQGAVDAKGAKKHSGRFTQNIDSNAVFDLQTVLKGLGYYVEPDGYFGEQTTAALRSALIGWRGAGDEYSFAEDWRPLAMQMINALFESAKAGKVQDYGQAAVEVVKELIPPTITVPSVFGPAPSTVTMPSTTTIPDTTSVPIVKDVPHTTPFVPSPPPSSSSRHPRGYLSPFVKTKAVLALPPSPTQERRKEEPPMTEPSERFQVAIGPLLDKEGGFVNDPVDLGGMTMMGVTRKWFPDEPLWAVVDEILARGGNPNEAKGELRPSIEAFYKKEFWDKANCDVLPPGLDAQHFDFVVNAGKGATKALQIIANTFCQEELGGKIAEDGLRGPTTRKAASALGSLGDEWHETLVAAYKCAQGMHYLSLCKAKPAQKKFIKGWLLNRLEL